MKEMQIRRHRCAGGCKIVIAITRAEAGTGFHQHVNAQRFEFLHAGWNERDAILTVGLLIQDSDLRHGRNVCKRAMRANRRSC